MTNLKKGVYFLANNGVLDLTIAFLNSFRKHNPDISLCFIPFDDDVDQVLAMNRTYNFAVYEKSNLLLECDNISRKFHGDTNGAYRKLAMWDGAFDEFVYIDIDTIVLNNVEFAFNFLDEYPCLTSHSNIASVRNTVWKDTIVGTTHLHKVQIEFSANTGFITSKKGFLSMSEIKSRIDRALLLKDHMELHCREQPLLNYLIVTSGKPYTSLFVLCYHLKRKDEVMLEFWAGNKGAKVKDGQFKRVKPEERIFLIHWAGLWQPREIDFRLQKLLTFFGIRKKEVRPKLHIFMPYKSLWRYYRNLSGRT